MEPKQPPKPDKKALQDYARFSGLAMQMLATMLIFVFAGRWFDQWTGWKFPIGILAGVFLGLFASLYPVFRSTRNKN